MLPRRSGLTPLLALGVVACGDVSGPNIVAGVNLTELFAPPTQSEVSATLDDWNQRDVSAQNVEVVDSATVVQGFLNADPLAVRVLSHTVGGVRHFGAVIVPRVAAPASLPLLVLAHPGDSGVDLDATLALLGFTMSGTVGSFVTVVPSFRSEALAFRGTTYRSEGAPSPWDRDVDDALALLNAALGITPEADSGRIAVLGLSRGAGVGLLMALRDPRVDEVVEFFGPTDFFGPYVQDLVKEALRGTPRDLPGLNDLDAQFIQPLKRGDLTIPEVRAQLVRRSAVYFVDRLPQVQVHHGTADTVVSVSQAERLDEVMREADRGPPGYEFYLYPGGGHDAFTLPGSIDRTVAFLGRLPSSAPGPTPPGPAWPAGIPHGGRTRHSRSSPARPPHRSTRRR
jgi:hypothetical protein